MTSLGSGGAVLTTVNQHEHIRSLAVKIRSNVGDVDSVVAGIVCALSKGRAIGDAVRYGVAAGAVMTEGTELCRRQNTVRLYNEMTNSTADMA